MLLLYFDDVDNLHTLVREINRTIPHEGISHHVLARGTVGGRSCIIKRGIFRKDVAFYCFRKILKMPNFLHVLVIRLNV